MRTRSDAADRLLRQISALSDDELVAESRRIAATISAARTELGLVLAEVESRKLHHSFDCATVERFAGWHCQLSPTSARHTAALGRAVHQLPVLGDALVDGRLAADKAVMIAKVASPDSDAALVDLSQHTSMEQLRQVCAAWRRVDENDRSLQDDEEGRPPFDENQHPGKVVVFHDEQGIELRAIFDHVHGALILSALDAATAQVRTERAGAAPIDPALARPASGTPADVYERSHERLSRDQWRAEGLLRIFELGSSQVSDGLQPSGFSTQVVVHVSVDTLVDADESAGASHGPPDRLEPAGVALRRDAARWLACDAGILTVLEDGNGDPLHLGRRTTTITPQLRRAVHARYRSCTWPGCTSTIVQLHHRHHRSAGGHDDVENLVPLCRSHHGAVHRRGITIARDFDGIVHFWRPDGSPVLASAPSGPEPPGPPVGDAVEALSRRQRELGIDITDRRRLPQWCNDPFRLSDIIEGLQARRDAALRRTRPTGPLGERLIAHGSVIISDHRAITSRTETTEVA